MQAEKQKQWKVMKSAKGIVFSPQKSDILEQQK